MKNLEQKIQIASSAIILVTLSAPLFLALYANAYLTPFVERCVEHEVHVAAITFACALSGLASWVAWQGYQSTGEVFQKYLSGAFLAFGLVYLPHGLLTFTAESNIMLFLLYGPASRLAMLFLLAVGVAQYGQVDVSTRGRERFFAWVAIGCAGLCLITALLAYSPIAKELYLRGGMEAVSSLMAGYVIYKFFKFRDEAYLTGYLAAGMFLFIQSMAVFVIAKPWDIVWWMAHGIFAGGFMLIAYASLTALRTRGQFFSSLSPSKSLQQLFGLKAELERTNASVIAASEQKARFLANISHDLRTPLNGILGLVEIIRQDKKQTDLKENIESLDAASHSLLGLIDDFLEYARIDASEVILSPSATSLGSLMQQVERTVSGQVHAKGLALQTLMSEDLKSAFVMVDKPRLGRVLLNLLSNSIKFTDKGSITLSMVAKEHLVIDQMCLITFKVEDTGCGVPEHIKDKMFTPFSTSERANNCNATGTGLGLSVVKKLVDQMNGVIHWRSQQGRGTTFEIDIPLRVVKQISDQEAFVQREPVDDRDLCKKCGQLNGLHVLVVDDSPLNVKVCSKLLENAGAHAVKASSAVAAIKCIEESKQQGFAFDLILMDIQMPDIDGLEATQMIKKIEGYEKTPIVALTGSAINTIREQALASGMVDFLAKPLDPDLLITKTCVTAGRANLCTRFKSAGNVFELTPNIGLLRS